MEQINNHSPLPWSNDGCYILDLKLESISEVAGLTTTATQDRFNSDFIVTACNSYYQSQETISALTERVKELEGGLGSMISSYDVAIEFLDDGKDDPSEGLGSVVAAFGSDIDKARALLTPKNNGE